MGPRPWGRGDFAGRGAGPRLCRAAMGPRPWGRGDLGAGGITGGNPMPQWGHGRGAVGTVIRYSSRSTALLPQWGHGRGAVGTRMPLAAENFVQEPQWGHGRGAVGTRRACRRPRPGPP